MRDELPFNRRHAPSRQFGIGSASHATQVTSASFSGLPRYPALAVSRGSSPPQVRSGRLSLYSPTRASIPESGISISNPIRPDNHKDIPPLHILQYMTRMGMAAEPTGRHILQYMTWRVGIKLILGGRVESAGGGVKSAGGKVGTCPRCLLFMFLRVPQLY